MPVSRKEFNKGIAKDSLEIAVLFFLRQNPDNAYDSQELSLKMGVDRERVERILDTLLGKEAVASRENNNTAYFVAR